MPYGIPWTSVIGYRCVKCGDVHTDAQYRPYCGLCGAEQPDESRAQATGLAIPGPTSGKKSTRELDEIARFITEHHGKAIRLWNYCVSHCELELRLRHSGAPCESKEPWLNTVIYCAATKYIQVPTSAWDSAMVIETKDTKYGIQYILVDVPSNVRIECSMLTLYFDVEPGY